MPNETIDTLQLKVNSDAKNASAGLDRLAASLLGVNKAVGRGTSGLAKYSSDLRAFSEAAGKLNGIKLPDFSGFKVSESLKSLKDIAPGLSTFADSVKSFKDVRAGQVTSAVKALEKLSQLEGLKNLQNLGDFSGFTGLSQGLREFSEVARNLTTLDPKQINTAISALRRITNIDLSQFASNAASMQGVDFTALSNLGTAFQSLTNSLASSDKISKGIQTLFTSISRLVSSAQNIQIVAQQLPILTPVLRDFANEMAQAAAVSDGTASLVSALSQLASAGKKAEAVSAALPGITSGVEAFITALSKAPKLNTNVVNAVSSLSQLAAAGAKAGSAAGSLQSKITGLSSALSTLKSRATKATGNMKSFARQLLGSLGIVGGLYTAIRGIKSSIDIASDLTEVQNVVDVTFGDMKQKVEDMAKTSIGDFGMSELTVKQISSRFQAMGVAMGFAQDEMSDMSINLTKLAADMASFYNVEQADVAQDLEAVFTGMTRPLMLAA